MKFKHNLKVVRIWPWNSNFFRIGIACQVETNTSRQNDVFSYFIDAIKVIKFVLVQNNPIKH